MNTVRMRKRSTLCHGASIEDDPTNKKRTRCASKRAHEGRRGDTNNDLGRGDKAKVKSKKIWTVQTGHNKRSSGRSPTNCNNDLTKKERGKGDSSPTLF